MLTNIGTQTIETERLILRRFEYSDTEAVLRNWAGDEKVQICAREKNIPSRGVIGKCGFTYEGTLRDYFLTENGYESRMYFSILQSEYLPE